MKRFTATEKWDKTWFQDLPPHLKCLWQYMCDKSDCAGVWEPNWKLASLQIGKSVSASDLQQFDGRVAVLKGGKILIGSFVEFQYGKLSEACKAHIPIFRTIEKHRVSIGYAEAINSLKETETEEEQEPEEGMQGEKPKPENKARGTIEEIVAFCIELGFPGSDGEACFHKWMGNGWTNKGEAIKCWKSTIRSWSVAKFLPSQKNGTTTRPNGTPNRNANLNAGADYSNIPKRARQTTDWSTGGEGQG